MKIFSQNHTFDKLVCVSKEIVRIMSQYIVDNIHTSIALTYERFFTCLQISHRNKIKKVNK